VELANGVILATGWQLDFGDTEFPLQYAISRDEGQTFEASRSTGVMGQAHCTAPLPAATDQALQGGALMAYNQRKHGEPGVRLLLAYPTAGSAATFGVVADEMIWAASGDGTQSNSSGTISDWTDFSFGEPSVTVCRGGDGDGDGGGVETIVTNWCVEQDVEGQVVTSGVRCHVVRVESRRGKL
jgi:hypothetical protein